MTFPGAMNRHTIVGKFEWPPEIFDHISDEILVQNALNKSIFITNLIRLLTSPIDLLCEPGFFPSINNIDAFNKVKSESCLSAKQMSSLVAPGIHDDGCLLQQDPINYSCTAKSKSTRRLCPCRDYRVGQSALCETCL